MAMASPQVNDPANPIGMFLDEAKGLKVGDKISDGLYKVVDEMDGSEDGKWVAKIDFVAPSRHVPLNPVFRSLHPLYREGIETYPSLVSMSGTDIPIMKSLFHKGPFICLLTEAMDSPLKDYVLDNMKQGARTYDLFPIVERIVNILDKLDEEGMIVSNLTKESFMVANEETGLLLQQEEKQESCCMKCLVRAIRLFDMSKVDLATSTPEYIKESRSYEPKHLAEIRCGYASVVLIVAVLSIHVQARLDGKTANDDEILPWAQDTTVTEVFQDKGTLLEATGFYERLPNEDVRSGIREALTACYSLSELIPVDSTSILRALIGKLTLKKKLSRKEQRQLAADYMSQKKKPSRKKLSRKEQRQLAADYMGQKEKQKT